MKKEDVPQDDDFSQNGKYKEVTYAVDEKGAFEQVLSKGWQPKNDALKYVWDVINEQTREIGNKVIKGELSPIAYYMEKSLMDLKILSKYMELPKRKVKKHLHLKEFEKLDDTILQQYADLFEISLEDLKNIQKIRDEIKTHENQSGT
jgi:hypothetical protein